MSIESFNDSIYYSLDEWMIPDYIKNKDYIKLVVSEVYSILEVYRSPEVYRPLSAIAINDFALWLHGFKDKEVYDYLYEKNKFELPSIDIFARIEKCYTEYLKLLEPVAGNGRLIKIRVYNYNSNNVRELSYQSGFNSRQQLFEDAPILVIKILDLDVVPFYFLEFLQPVSSADREFVKTKLHRIPEINSKKCILL